MQLTGSIFALNVSRSYKILKALGYCKKLEVKLCHYRLADLTLNKIFGKIIKQKWA